MALQKLAKNWPEIPTLHETSGPAPFEFGPADVLTLMQFSRKEGDLCRRCEYSGQCPPDECLLLADASN